VIPHTDISGDSWQQQLRDVITSGEQLLRALQLRPEQAGFSELASRDFALKVPRAFVARMRIGDPADPLLRQVLSHRRELLAEPGYGHDPVGETGDAVRQPGIIQKYHGRVLLMLSGGCAINCRYCFRRHFPYAEHRNNRREWQDALETIAADPSISEVILSGGDPLLVSDRQLAELAQGIAAIGHVQRLRVHTRLPVVIPERVTAALLQALSGTRLPCVMVIHSNHANELDAAVGNAMRALQARGITLLNQAVLLAGVNDDADTLVALSERLFAIGVLPYYLHLLDKVQGAAHFDIPQPRGIALIETISARLPGYLVPRLVREEAGAPAKTGVMRQALPMSEPLHSRS
jgi:EF-P beta-lysylation protein EpmB